MASEAQEIDDVTKFKKLIQWVTEAEDITVEIDTSYYELAKTAKEERIVNGVAGSDGYIILYADKTNMDWDYLTSMLIHEIGHVILFQEEKNWHTEKDAWICGIEIVPKELHSNDLEKHCIECLRSYNYKRFGWVKKILS